MAGSIQQRGPRRWEVTVDIGRDPLTGRRRRTTRTVTGTKTDARQAADALAVAARNGHLGGPTAATVAELLDRWLDHTAADLSPTTLDGHRSKIDRYLRPGLGPSPLRTLTAARLDETYRALRERGGAGGRPLSPTTVRHCHAILRRALGQAVRWGWLDRNPAEHATPPRTARTEVAPPTFDELARIVTELDEDMADLVHLAVITGARRGELCALRWGDVDLTAGQVHVAGTIVESRDGSVTRRAPKSGRGRRNAIDPTTVAMLTARRRRQAERALAVGATLDDTSQVFAGDAEAQEPLRPVIVSKRWANAARRAGVRARLHDLRHLAVTELLAAGIPVRQVADRVGHASGRMTLDVYGHAIAAADLVSAELLAGRLLEVRPETG